MQALLRTRTLTRSPLFRKGEAVLREERLGDLLDLERLKKVQRMEEYEKRPEKPSAEWKVKAQLY